MIGARIRQARLRAGLTLDTLRDALLSRGHSITKASLSKYERDESRLPAPLLFNLAQVLDVTPDYFLAIGSEVPITFERFRKKSRFGVRKQEQLKATVRDQVERYLELVTLMGTDIDSPWADFRPTHVTRPDQAEQVAAELRDNWKLGLAPIESVCHILEDKGFIILEHQEPGDDFDGLSGWIGEPPGRPLIIIDPSKPTDRRRLSMAHELGHLMMKHPDDLPDRDCESLAYRFAGSFLVPEQVARQELGRKRRFLELRELEILKQKYGLSMFAWIRRAKDLEIISEIQYKLWCRVFAIRGWRNEEPVRHENPFEEPTRRRLLTLHALAERRISPAQAERLSPGILNESRTAPLGATSLRSLLAEARAHKTTGSERDAAKVAQNYSNLPDFLEEDLDEDDWFVDPGV